MHGTRGPTYIYYHTLKNKTPLETLGAGVEGTDVPTRNKGSRECIYNVGTLQPHTHFTTDSVPGATSPDSVSSRQIGRELWTPPILCEDQTTPRQVQYPIIVCSYAESTTITHTTGTTRQGTLLYARHSKYLTNLRLGRLMIILISPPENNSSSI